MTIPPPPGFFQTTTLRGDETGVKKGRWLGIFILPFWGGRGASWAGSMDSQRIRDKYAHQVPGIFSKTTSLQGSKIFRYLDVVGHIYLDHGIRSPLDRPDFFGHPGLEKVRKKVRRDHE